MKSERASFLDDKTDSIAGEKNKNKTVIDPQEEAQQSKFLFPQMYERATDRHTHTHRERGKANLGS
jgi:hypothetical protein